MSQVLLAYLIGAGMLAVLMTALGVVSIWRSGMPTLGDVMLILVLVAAVGLGIWLLYGPGVPDTALVARLPR